MSHLIPEERPYGMASSAVRIGPGPEVMAGAIGMQQILNDVRANLEDAGSLAPDGGEIPDEHLDFHRCLLDPASYEVWVQRRDAGTGWLVVIWPKGWCNRESYGGGGEFEIDGESFQILRREIYE